MRLYPDQTLKNIPRMKVWFYAGLRLGCSKDAMVTRKLIPFFPTQNPNPDPIDLPNPKRLFFLTLGFFVCRNQAW